MSTEKWEFKSECYCRLIEDAKVDSSRLCKAIKETLPSNHNELMQFLVMENKLQTHPKGIAETLNNHFSSIGKRLAKALSGSKPIQYGAVPNSSFSFKYVTSAFVEKQLPLIKPTRWKY